MRSTGSEFRLELRGLCYPRESQQAFLTGLPQAPLKNKGLRLMCPCIHPIESSKPLTFMDIAGVIDGCKILIFLLHGYKKIK